MPLLMIGAQPLIKKKLSYLVTMRPLFVLFVTCEKNDGHLDHMMVIKSHTYSYQCQGGYFSLGGTSLFTGMDRISGLLLYPVGY